MDAGHSWEGGAVSEDHCTFDELIGAVEGNEFDMCHTVAGVLTLVSRRIAEKVTAECVFLRFEGDGEYLPASILAGRSAVGFASDFIEQTKNKPAKRTEVILRACAHHMLGHQTGWDHKDQGEEDAAMALAHEWLAEWAS